MLHVTSQMLRARLSHLRRYTTFSKRKTGIMKKAYELSTLTGTQVMLLVASETGHVYTFATRKLQPMITSDAGKALIQTCLNSPDDPMSTVSKGDQRMSATGYEETELTYNVADDEQQKEMDFVDVAGGDSNGESADEDEEEEDDHEEEEEMTSPKMISASAPRASTASNLVIQSSNQFKEETSAKARTAKRKSLQVLHGSLPISVMSTAPQSSITPAASFIQSSSSYSTVSSHAPPKIVMNQNALPPEVAQRLIRTGHIIHQESHQSSTPTTSSSSSSLATPSSSSHPPPKIVVNQNALTPEVVQQLIRTGHIIHQEPSQSSTTPTSFIQSSSSSSKVPPKIIMNQNALPPDVMQQLIRKGQIIHQDGSFHHPPPTTTLTSNLNPSVSISLGPPSSSTSSSPTPLTIPLTSGTLASSSLPMTISEAGLSVMPKDLSKRMKK